MIASIHERFESLHVRELLNEHCGLRIVPSRNDSLVITGVLRFQASSPIHEVIEDQYELEIRVPAGFPIDEPTARETARRIPPDFHKLEGNLLCLGSPTEIRMKLRQSPTLPAFVDLFLIPYLYGYSYYERYGVPPFGELSHGDKGIREQLAALFCAPSSNHPEEFLRLAGLKKRVANKRTCPCGSRKRLGRCHNRRINHLRRTVGRKWFTAEYQRVSMMLGD